MKKQAIGALVLFFVVGLIASSASAHAAGSRNQELYNQTSDPVFLELEALEKRLGKVERRVGSVEKKIQELAKVGQAQDMSIDAILAGDQPQWLVVSFGNNNDVALADLAKIRRFTKQKWVVKQIVLVPVVRGGDNDKEAAEIINEARTEALQARYAGLHRAATKKEAEMLRAKGILGAIVRIVPPVVTTPTP